jgi:hypothetical protein
VRDCGDHNPDRSFTIDDQEREAAQNIPTPRTEDALPTSGRLQNIIYRLIEFCNELICGTEAPICVSLDGYLQLSSGFRMETGTVTCHPCRGLGEIAIRSRE